MQVKFATGAEDERSAVGRERGLFSEVAFDFEEVAGGGTMDEYSGRAELV